MRFCDICENLLKMKHVDGKLKYSCEICKQHYDLNPEDTKLKTVRVNVSDNVYIKNKQLIEMFKDDNMLQIIERICSKCSHNIMKQAVLGKNMDFIFICTKCKHIDI